MFGPFWLIFGQKMDPTTHGANFFHKRNAQEKFQLKIPTLSKNDCSATWCPNCYRKKGTFSNLRNGYRYEKHVVIFRPTLLTVAALFKPTVGFKFLPDYGDKIEIKYSAFTWVPLHPWYPQKPPGLLPVVPTVPACPRYISCWKAHFKLDSFLYTERICQANRGMTSTTN